MSSWRISKTDRGLLARELALGHKAAGAIQAGVCELEVFHRVPREVRIHARLHTATHETRGVEDEP